MSGNCPSPNEKDLFRVVRGVRDLFEGRRNTTGSFTLAANTTITTVTHSNFGAASVPKWSPTTANAATALATTYVSSRANGSFVLTHANNAQTDRTFCYSIDG
jgi:hypothetical protein